MLNCRFDAAPALQSSSIESLSLNGSHLPGLSADWLEVRGSVLMRDGFVATGDVRLGGAKLGGNLECIGATFRTERDAKGNPGCALWADGLEARGFVFLHNVKATGAVRLLWAKLGGSLECAGATFRAERDAKGNPGVALAADGLEAKGSVFLHGVRATGAVRLLGIKLGGKFECAGAKFRAEKDAKGYPGHALSADGLDAKGSVFLCDSFAAVGSVRLIGASLGGES